MGTLRWDVVRRLLPATGGDPAQTSLEVLEIGCGQGAVAVRLAARYSYLGLEPDRESYERAAHRLAALGRGEVHRGLLADIDAARRFDLVVAFEVMEHIEDDDAAMADWVGRLRPGGMLIVSTPGYADRFGPSDVAVGHYRRYEPAALRALLEGAGLSAVEVLHYGMPAGYVIEAVRNRILRRRAEGHTSETMPERTSSSGRTLQPSGLAGAAIAVALWPMRLAQRAFPQRGPTLVAHGRLPAS